MARVGIAVVLAAAVFAGCVRTELGAPELHPRIEKLLEANRRPLSLSVKNEADQTLGHQYLLFVIPFGRITHPGAETALSGSLMTRLALAGYSPTLAAGPVTSPSRAARLEVKLSDMQVSAYDYFFLRRIYCRVALEGTLLSPDGKALRTEYASAELGDYQPFAFKRELQHVLGKTIDQGSILLLKNLGLAV